MILKLSQPWKNVKNLPEKQIRYVDGTAEFLIHIKRHSSAAASFLRVVSLSVAAADLDVFHLEELLSQSDKSDLAKKYKNLIFDLFRLPLLGSCFLLALFTFWLEIRWTDSWFGSRTWFQLSFDSSLLLMKICSEAPVRAKFFDQMLKIYSSWTFVRTCNW